MATELIPAPKNALTLYEIKDNLAALANMFEELRTTGMSAMGLELTRGGDNGDE